MGDQFGNSDEDMERGDHELERRKEEEMMRSLYEAEKRAGLLRPQSEIDQDLIDAGRGHLVRRP